MQYTRTENKTSRRYRSHSVLFASAGLLFACLSFWRLWENPLVGFATLRTTSLLTSKNLRTQTLNKLCRLCTLSSSDSSIFEDQKSALKGCLSREYTSFFRPFEAEFYLDNVTFQDPLNMLEGKAKYRQNVEMLSCESAVGNLLFKDGFIDLHAVEDVPGDQRRLRTRWTLGFTFKLLPWQPVALFTGISEYTIDGNAKVVSQRDYWDTINLCEDGYVAEEPLAGLVDLCAQFVPTALQSWRPPVPFDKPEWDLLRRAAAYSIYRRVQDGKLFALEVQAERKGDTFLKRELEKHGLQPGEPMDIDVSGSAEGKLHVVELLPPHPWMEASTS